MQRLELVVSQRSENNRRQIGRLGNPFEKLLDGGTQLVAGWRRHESRIVEPSARCADDDDPVPKLSGIRKFAGGASARPG